MVSIQYIESVTSVLVFYKLKSEDAASRGYNRMALASDRQGLTNYHLSFTNLSCLATACLSEAI